MLTTEVVNILKKAILLTLALGFAVCSHLRPSYDFSLGGLFLDTNCSRAAARMAREAALAAAEEILPGRAELPEARAHLRLSFRPGADSAPELCGALLEATPGIMLGEAVYVHQRRLGTVRDAGAFARSINEYIENTLPTWASSGAVRGLELRRCYTRTDFEIPAGDMIMLITGLSPVMYTDGNGRISPV